MMRPRSLSCWLDSSSPNRPGVWRFSVTILASFNWRRLGASILFFLLPVIANAQDQGTISVIKAFGLIGAWAVDCSREATAANEHLVVSVDSYGIIELRSDSGSDGDDAVYRIVEAMPRGRSQISLRQALAPDGTIIAKNVLVRSGSSLRLWSSQGLDGSVSVRDGEMTTAKSYGQKTNWMERCDIALY